MNISIKNKFSMIIIFMSILSLIFAYIISIEVLSKHIFEKEKLKFNEKIFYVNREFNLIENLVFKESVMVSQNLSIVNFANNIQNYAKKEREERLEVLTKYFERSITTREKLIPNIKIEFVDKTSNYINPSTLPNLKDKENIKKALGLKNNYPENVIDYVKASNEDFEIKMYVPVYHQNLKEVIGLIITSYKYDKFLLEHLKNSYGLDIILEDLNGKSILSTFDINYKIDIQEEFLNNNSLELGNKLYLTQVLPMKEKGLNFIFIFDREDSIREKAEISSYLFLSLFFVFSLLFVISSTMLNVFIDSLKNLTLKINSLKEGNFNINLGSLKNNNDEIGILAHDFENMVHILKSKINELEEANLNKQHYANRLELANDELKKSQKNIKDKSENIEKINKLLNNRISEISNMYYLMMGISKHMLDDKFYDVIVKGVREGLMIPKVAIYLKKYGSNNAILKKSLGFDNIKKEFNLEGKEYILTKKDSIESDEIMDSTDFNLKEDSYIFPLVSRREDETLYGFLLISKGEKLTQEFKKSILTYVNALLLAIENRLFYIRLLNENTKLEETTKELQESEKMKNIFISNISHELRIPLVPIKGYHEIMLEEHMGKLNDKQKKAMKISLKNIERLQEIIENVLNYSRIESGKYQMVNTSTNIQEVIEEVFQRLDNLFDTKPINIIQENITSDIFVYGDKEALKQIFLNLISNSIKFSSEKGVTITISISSHDDKYKINIKDNGVGMDKSKISQVLESFRQLDEGNTRRYRGLGLGLTVVEKILHYYGEKLYIQSKKDFGTEVYFYFKKGADSK